MDCDDCHQGIEDHDPDGRCKGGGYYETAYASLPTCPWCGHEDQDWWDGTSLKNDEDDEDRDCPSCGREYNVELHSVPEFTSRAPNLEARAREEERKQKRLAEHEVWQRSLDEAAAKMPPGTRFRDVDGGLGTIADEKREPGAYVPVIFDGRDYVARRNPLELEVLG